MKKSRILQDSVVVNFESISNKITYTEKTPKAAIEEDNIRLLLENFALTEMLRRSEIRITDKKITSYRDAEFVFQRDVAYAEIDDNYSKLIVNGKDIFFGEKESVFNAFLSGKIDIHSLK